MGVKHLLVFVLVVGAVYSTAVPPPAHSSTTSKPPPDGEGGGKPRQGAAPGGEGGVRQRRAAPDGKEGGKQQQREEVEADSGECEGVECPQGQACVVTITHQDEACIRARNCPETATCVVKDTKPGVCPQEVPMYVEKPCNLPPNPPFCSVDDECQGRMKCCPSSVCQRGVCGMPRHEKSGRCPDELLVASFAECSEFPNNQLISCERDNDCPGYKKCCPSLGCGGACATPKDLPKPPQQEQGGPPFGGGPIPMGAGPIPMGAGPIPMGAGPFGVDENGLPIGPGPIPLGAGPIPLGPGPIGIDENGIPIGAGPIGIDENGIPIGPDGLPMEDFDEDFEEDDEDDDLLAEPFDNSIHRGPGKMGEL